MTRIPVLRDLILKAKHAYYYSGQPIMSDAEYDALEDELRMLAPHDAVLALVGSPVPADTMLTKARHSIPMGSQSKVNSDEEFLTWWSRAGATAVVASLKGDGASAAAYYRDGQLTQVISRGDGTVGEDITANAMRFKGLPAWVHAGEAGFSGAVRFEVILTVEDWSVVDPQRSTNPRNAGTGIMGRKNGLQSELLTAFAFDLDESTPHGSAPFASESDKLARLTELGFHVMPHQRCDSPDAAVAYYRDVTARRASIPFWIDGVVMKIDDITAQRALGVTAGRPKGQIAWKFDSSGAETVLLGVTVSGGHTGALSPIASLEPVDIGGTTVSSASLANFDEIRRLDLAVGDTVWVIKANDIIPKIMHVIERPAHRQRIDVPEVCPFCQGAVARRRIRGDVDGVIVECRNGECPKKASGKLKHWISSLAIEGIGGSVLDAMIQQFALEDPSGLYALRDQADTLAEMLINTEKRIRLGRKRAESILAEIDRTRDLTLSQFLGSLGLDHLGSRRVHLMTQGADGALDTLDGWRAGHLRNAEMAANAGVPNIGAQIQDNIDEIAPVIDRLLAAGITVRPAVRETVSESATTPQVTMMICISGKLPSGRKKGDYEAPLRAAGYTLVDDMKAGVTLLVLADPDSTSTKAQKARALGVRIIGEPELITLTSTAP